MGGTRPFDHLHKRSPIKKHFDEIIKLIFHPDFIID